jgi:hypothetical protein
MGRTNEKGGDPMNPDIPADTTFPVWVKVERKNDENKKE